MSILADKVAVLMNAGHYDQAERIVAHGLRHDPDDPDLLAILADLRLIAGDITAARQLAEASLARRPSAMAFLVRSHTLQHDPTYKPPKANWFNRPEMCLLQALRNVEMGLAMEPCWPALHFRRAVLLEQLELPDPAWQAVHAGLEHDPSDLNCLRFKAHLLVRRGKFSEADTAALHALAAAPDEAMAHLAKAMVATHRGDQLQAVEHATVALRLSPDDPDVRDVWLQAQMARYALFNVPLRILLRAERFMARPGAKFNISLVLFSAWAGLVTLTFLLGGPDTGVVACFYLGAIGVALWESAAHAKRLFSALLAYHPRARRLITPGTRAKGWFLLLFVVWIVATIVIVAATWRSSLSTRTSELFAVLFISSSGLLLPLAVALSVDRIRDHLIAWSCVLIAPLCMAIPLATRQAGHRYLTVITILCQILVLFTISRANRHAIPPAPSTLVA